MSRKGFFSCCLLFSLLSVSPLDAQVWKVLALDDPQIDSSDVKALKLEIDNISFFHDNEYSSKLTKGYSLPGVWLAPRLAYAPIPQVQMELGFYALFYGGANKYSSYAYHDIARWKGNQYQRGAHALPWFRAKAQLPHLTVVLGNIHGAENHQLITPLFNSEHNVSQDPEMGFQLLWHRGIVHMDTWLNWQSYIFEEDTHQEAFTVGSNWNFALNPARKDVRWSVPLQTVIQHRGGEQDTTDMGVQTLANVAVGLKYEQDFSRKVLSNTSGEVNVLGAFQQKGTLWPFDRGCAFHAEASATLLKSLQFSMGGFSSPKHYVSLYGAPFFSTLSIRDDKDSWDGNNTLYAKINYKKTFHRDYVLGVEASAFSTWLDGNQETNFSFGVYFRVHPKFTLKRW